MTLYDCLNGKICPIWPMCKYFDKVERIHVLMGELASTGFIEVALKFECNFNYEKEPETNVSEPIEVQEMQGQ